MTKATCDYVLDVLPLTPWELTTKSHDASYTYGVYPDKYYS